MSFKTELHCHTRDYVGSRSAESGAEKAETYVRAGYDTVVLTNHYRPYAEDHAHMVRWLFRAGEEMREAAAGRLRVITGMELNFRENGNDYLVFGMTEEMLLGLPGIFDMGIREFHRWASANGVLVIQAHPFRVGSVPADPEDLDGAEIFNTCNPPEANEGAANWAKAHADAAHRHFILTSGSDHHKSTHTASGGIETEKSVRTMDELVAVLKSGEYRLLRG